MQVPEQTTRLFEAAMAAAQVALPERGDYRKWLRFYLEFCGKYNHPADQDSSLGPFLDNLAAENQAESERRQAEQAVRLYLALPGDQSQVANQLARAGHQSLPTDPPVTGSATPPNTGEPPRDEHASASDGPSHNAENVSATGFPDQPSRTPVSDENDAARFSQPPSDEAATPGAKNSWVKGLNALRDAIRLQNYSQGTSKCYVHWARKFQVFTSGKPIDQLDSEDVKNFLTDLVVRQNVAASTQNQAFNALLFFYRHVLGREFGMAEGVVREKRQRHVPVVLSRPEIDRVVAHLEPPIDLVVLLLYGCGLRVSEALGLRVQCFNLDEGLLIVYDSNEQKSRSVPLPMSLMPRIRDQLARVAALHREDLARHFAGAFLPKHLEKKSPNAGREFSWQWFFPAARLTLVKATDQNWRYHMLASEIQKAVKRATEAAGIPKHVTPNTFRHCFASHLLQANVDIRTIQERLGHSDVKTTKIYTHTVRSRARKDAGSPLDMDSKPEEDNGSQP